MKQFTACFLCVLLLASTAIHAQFSEPEVRTIDAPKNLFDEGYRTGVGLQLELSDFGFGAGAQFRKGISPYNELLFNIGIAGLRDPSEQAYIDIFFNNRVIPSKYNRVVTFPVALGFKRRLFASQVSDNFRVHTGAYGGPTLALITPYFDDRNGNGYREADIRNFASFEPVIDIFRGFRDRSWEFGWHGGVFMGIDFGDNFASLQSFQFGYSFYYFDNGLQILEPWEPQRDAQGFILDPNGNGILELDPDGDGNIFDDNNELQPSNGPSSFFGSARITFIFGWMW